MNSRGLTIALVVSLVVNVFVIGAVGGAIGMRQRVVEQRGRPAGGNPLMRVAERLPEDVRGRYVAAMRGQAQANRHKMIQAREARAEAMRAFADEPYDAAAAAAALARARVAEDAMRATLETTVVEFAKDLGPAERKVIAQGLRGGPNGGRRGRGGPGREGMGPNGMGREGRGGFEGGGGPEAFGPPTEPAPEQIP